MIPRKHTAKTEIFSGWKEIADYLGKGVRTAQRYERELRLPIHRLPRKSGGTVFATKAELDAWVSGGPTRTDLMKNRLQGRANRLGADFLQIDSEIALTFSGIALHTSDQEKKRRTIQTARNAYRAILRLRENIEIDEARREKLNANLKRLQSELQSLGENV